MAVRMALGLVALALLCAPGAAKAQATGDVVRVETERGAVEGTLVDRLPQGYLVNTGRTSVVVPYVKVRAISRLAPAPLATPPPPPAPAPAPAAPAGQLTDDGPVPAPDVASDSVPPPPVAAPDTVPPPPPADLPPPPPVYAPVKRHSHAPPPPPDAYPPVHYQRRSTLVMATGIALFAAGMITTTIGAGVALDGYNKGAVYDGYHSSYDAANREMTNGYICIGAGVAGALLGITAWSIGARRVVVADADVEKPLKPTFAIGPGSAQVSVKF